MCGIFALLNNNDHFNYQFVNNQFEKGKGRGPENSILKQSMIKVQFGFHRLAINGLNEGSNQPITINDISVICNGEIYNYKELYNMMGVKPTTDSDCEVILHLYKKYGIEQTLQMLDGVFAFVLIDYRMCNKTSKIYVARDPYGVRPLYYFKPVHVLPGEKYEDFNNLFGFASELKVLNDFYQETETNETFKKYNIEQFEPGTYSVYELTTKVAASWYIEKENVRYHTTGFHTNYNNNSQIYDIDCVVNDIQHYLVTAVEKRCCTTERPIACLLSGGLDSSLITALVNDYHKKNNLPQIETYSIGLAGSVDLQYAKIVAEHLGTKHTEIVLSEMDFLNAIPEVIKTIESYDTTTVRASIGNWLLGKYISQHSDAKVIFNGDGSDELLGGYLYMQKAPDMIEFDKECRRLLKDIHTFDVLRSDKSISSHGLEPRTPFLDRTWVQYYLSIPLELRYHPNEQNMEKYLLRSAFSIENYCNSDGNELLPYSVLWRRKEAFSDGVSQNERSLYQIIQEFTDKIIGEEYSEYLEDKDDINYENLVKKMPEFQNINHLLPKTSEQIYYRVFFEKEYNGLGSIIPYFWMPKYVDAKDASARTLEIYLD
jgi:asparagine synthase (glutamine-hydrolysing)